jgi:hypothetical protein
MDEGGQRNVLQRIFSDGKINGRTERRPAPDAKNGECMIKIGRFLGITVFVGVPLTLLAQPQEPTATYVGSTACKMCHPAIYERWSKTRMANVVRDPKTHPDAILPDLTKPDPVVKFTKDDIAFVYGSKWKQRYLACPVFVIEA